MAERKTNWGAFQEDKKAGKFAELPVGTFVVYSERGQDVTIINDTTKLQRFTDSIKSPTCVVHTVTQDDKVPLDGMGEESRLIQSLGDDLSGGPKNKSNPSMGEIFSDTPIYTNTPIGSDSSLQHSLQDTGG